MIPNYRTSDMEASALRLDSEYSRVMVRAISILPNPIRLRVGLLESIRPFYLRNDPAFESEAERWKVENGTLINYRPYAPTEAIREHDACLLCEAPLSLDLLDDMTRDTRAAVVVYRPPNWKAHEEAVFTKYPTGDACERFLQTVRSIPLPPEFAAMATALKIPTVGTYAATDDELRGVLGLENRPEDFPPLRRRAMKQIGAKQWSTVQLLIPRIEPEDATLHVLYRFIKDELPASGVVRLARDNVLSKKARFWKQALRALVRSGSVEKRGVVGFYFADYVAPDYARIHAEHTGAMARLSRLTRAIDALPEYPLSDAPAGRASQQKSAPAQPESAARAHGTAD